MSEYHKSLLHKQRISKVHKGKVISEEQKEKQSEAMKDLYASGYKHPMLGRTHSKEAREKIRQARLGTHISDFVKQRVREAQTGRMVSEETRVKIRSAQLGKRLSDITKEKIREQMKERWKHKEYKTNQIEKRIGEKNPRWLGGLSYQGYDSEFSRPFKKMIRQRDNYTCLLCNIHQERLSRALHIHHVNYDKQLCIIENCVSLCQPCHNLTNLNRSYWIKFFQELLSKKYGYQYSPNGEAIINFNLKGGIINEDIKIKEGV
jgi:hypothetical protein